MEASANPFVFSVKGDSSHTINPGQKFYITRLVFFGGPADGNIALMTGDGTTEIKDSLGREVNAGFDPHIIAEGLVAADSRTEITLNRSVRGIYLDDVPPGGKVEVYHGVE